jgi:aminoglycoside phosphotransferase family enzyme
VPARALAPIAAAPGADERLRFLCTPAAHASHLGSHLGRQAEVQAIQTHMSWVFVVGDHVLKLKKAVRQPYLDFSTLRAREFYCREELRLNARLAPGIYLGLMALRWDGRALALVHEAGLPPTGQTLDWLVLMRRLPHDRMLDRLIARGGPGAAEIDALGDVLAAFYRSVAALQVPGSEHLAYFAQQQALNRDLLPRPAFALDGVGKAVARLDRALEHAAPLLRARAERGCIVDGHGDLRPEHVCMLERPVVIDALEFDPALRRSDPLDEIAFLGMECAAAGAAWIGPRLADRCLPELDHGARPALWPLYTAYRALLRARLAVAHLLEPQVREPQRWRPLAQRYVDLALQALQGTEGCVASGGASARVPP